MSQKHLLVVGGAGNLGRAIVNSFSKNWKVTSLDIKANSQAHHNVLLGDLTQKLEDRVPKIYKDLEGFSKHYDSVFCVAGGWAGGSIQDPKIFSQLQLMHDIQVVPAFLTAHLASKYLNPAGLLLFTGAATPFRQPAPFMLAYAVEKTAVHGLAMNLVDCEDLPADTTIATILPETIDTPENRKAMPDEDFSQWSPPEKIAEMLKRWAEDKNSRPKNGSFAIIKTLENREIMPEFV